MDRLLEDTAKEEMALNETDRGWINNAIAEALKEHSRGWAQFFKQWSPLGVIVALGLFALSEWSKYVEFRTHTNDQIEKLLTQLGPLRALISANQPLRKQNQQAAKELLAEARQKSIPALSPAIVEEAGNSFVQASSQDPEAWKVALDFVSYRSSLNVSERPDLPQEKVGTPEATHYLVRSIQGKASPAMFNTFTTRLPISESARLEDIGTDLNRGGPETGPAWLILMGGSIVLDGENVRRVVFDGVEIHYRGGPLLMDKSIFINCTFVIENTEPGRKLGSELLASSTVKFQNGV